MGAARRLFEDLIGWKEGNHLISLILHGVWRSLYPREGGMGDGFVF